MHSIMVGLFAIQYAINLKNNLHSVKHKYTTKNKRMVMWDITKGFGHEFNSHVPGVTKLHK